VLPTQSIIGGNLILSFNRSEASATDTTVIVETSTTLTGWVPAEPNPVITTGPTTVTIPRNSESKLFVRLRALLIP